MVEIEHFLEEIKNKNILVVGDLILDEYWISNVNRISPEAPVPVAKIVSIERRIGGAGNVANNIVSLGGNVTLIGQVGKDKYKSIYEDLLRKHDINYFLIERDDFNTIRKIRILSHGHQMIRSDFEEPKKITKDYVNQIYRFIKHINFDLILVSDYNKGFVTKELMEMLFSFNKKILVDPKPKNISLFKGAYAMFPNEKELNEIIKGDGDYLEKSKKFIEKYDTNLILTRGPKGAFVLTKDDGNSNIPSKARQVYDVTGAGDTFFAAASLAIAVGYDLFNSAFLGNLAAGIVVSKVGTATVKPYELIREFNESNSKIKTWEEIKEFMKQHNDKTFVFTNGCFDILHVGHIRLLKEAKKQGDFLIVALNSDESVKELKGKERPIVPLNERMEIIASLEFVDFVTYFEELTPEKIISELKPHVHVKGGDYDPDDYNRMPEAKIVKSYGGRIHIVPLVKGKSTTSIIEKMRKKK